MQGGNGNDTYVVDNTGDLIDESETQGVDTVYSSLSEYELPDFVENLFVQVTIPDVGPPNGNNGTGNSADNIIQGNNLANKLAGLAGRDTLSGAGGADTLEGGIGSDEYRLIASTNGGSQITDAGGTSDEIRFLDNEKFVFDNLQRDDQSLVVDLNKDGNFESQEGRTEDLVIFNYFTGSGDAGTGFIEQVGNLTGDSIIEFFQGGSGNQGTANL